MSLQISGREPARHGEVLLFFETDTIVPASDVAKLLSALSSEYTKINKGHSLVVVRLEAGSLAIWFDGVINSIGPVAHQSKEYIDSATACIKFFGIIRQIAQRSKEQPTAIQSNRPGFKAVREIVRVAAKNGAALELSYNSPGGEKLKLKMAAADVTAIERDVSVEAASRRESQQMLSSPVKALLPSAGFDGTAFAAAVGDGPLSEEAQRIVKAMVLAMQSVGLVRAITEIAEDLIGRGRADIAAVLISEMDRLAAGGRDGHSVRF